MQKLCRRASGPDVHWRACPLKPPQNGEKKKKIVLPESWGGEEKNYASLFFFNGKMPYFFLKMAKLNGNE